MRILIAVCGLGVVAWAPHAQTQGHVRAYHVPSRALAANLVHAPDTAEIEVYLPRSYVRDRRRRYPVLYLLHGIEGTSKDWTRPGYQGMTIQDLMDSLTAAGRIKEMIVVVPTANNAYAGSFYANSPVTGNWEDYLSRELVAWVDSAFRTIPSPASRGIAGHSMGGFGAILMALRHADVFGAAYAMSPCCLAGVEDISAKNEAFGRMTGFPDVKALHEAESKGDFYPIAIVGLSAIMSPDTANPPLYVDLPYARCGDSICAVEPVLAKWRARFPVALVGQSREMLRHLRAPLRIDYGFDDQFPHIPPGARLFVDSLAAYRIPHRLDAYEGDHRNRIRERMTTIVLPFFSEVLSNPRQER
jgi:S-formylglutathione hydrolase